MRSTAGTHGPVEDVGDVVGVVGVVHLVLDEGLLVLRLRQEEGQVLAVGVAGHVGGDLQGDAADVGEGRVHAPHLQVLFCDQLRQALQRQGQDTRELTRCSDKLNTQGS